MTVLAFIIGVVLLVVGLAVSIALHELGHLLPAKAFGVRVSQYMIGFGPTIWSRRIGETEYGIKAIPAGGYISMAGMYPPSPFVAGPGRAARRARRRAASGRPDGFFATMVQDARLVNDETLEDTRGRPAFYELAVWKRVVIMLGGPVMNLLLAIVLFAIAYSGIGVQTATTTIAEVSQCAVTAESGQTECTPDDPPSPAAAAGILPGDVLLEVNGTPVWTFAEAATIIQASPNQTMDVVVQRGTEELTLRVTPMLAEREVLLPDGTTDTAEVGFVGMTSSLAFVPQPIWTGPQAAFAQTGAVAAIMVDLPVRVYQTAVDMFTGQERDPDGPLSVVGAGRLAGEVAAIDAPIADRVWALLHLLASLNIALFVFNLIPLLPLDGGHVVVALWDGLKRVWAKLTHRGWPEPADATKLVPVTFIVVIALIVMGGVLILADIVNPVQLFG